MGTDADETSGSSLAAWLMLGCARVREESIEPVRAWAFVGVPVVVGEFPPEGVAVAGTVVLMPGRRGALLEGAKGSWATVRGVVGGNECDVAIAYRTRKNIQDYKSRTLADGLKMSSRVRGICWAPVCSEDSRV